MPYKDIYHTQFVLFYEVIEKNYTLMKINLFQIFTPENTTHLGTQTLFDTVVCCLSHILSFSYSCASAAAQRAVIV